jgi:hypothetical protein
MSRLLERQVNTSRPIRLPTLQLLSVPGHAHDLKIRRLVRLQADLTGSPDVSMPITVGNFFEAVRAELSLAAGSGGEQFAIHGVRVYVQTANAIGATIATAGNVQLGVRVRDLEEGTGPSTLVSQFVDESSVSGVANVRWVYPVNNRPTFSRTQTLTEVLFDVDLTSSVETPSVRYPLTIDFDLDYTRVSNVPLVLNRSINFEGRLVTPSELVQIQNSKFASVNALPHPDAFATDAGSLSTAPLQHPSETN